MRQYGEAAVWKKVEKPDGQTLDDTAIRAEIHRKLWEHFTENLSRYSLTNEETASLEESRDAEETPIL